MTNVWTDAFKNIHSALAAAGDPDALLATYQPSAGAAVPDVPVIIEKFIDLQPAGFDSRVISQSITIEAALADLGKEPDKGETFTTATGTVYTVLSPIENDGHTVKVQVR